MNDLIVNILGWIGSIILIIAYWMNSKDMINAQTYSYQAMNIGASILLMINTIYYGAYPSSLVNIVWVIIGAFYITKIIKDGKQSS